MMSTQNRTKPSLREPGEGKRTVELERACLEKDKALSWLRTEIRITAPGYRDTYWAEKVLSGTDEAAGIIPPINFPIPPSPPPAAEPAEPAALSGEPTLVEQFRSTPEGERQFQQAAKDELQEAWNENANLRKLADAVKRLEDLPAPGPELSGEEFRAWSIEYDARQSAVAEALEGL